MTRDANYQITVIGRDRATMERNLDDAHAQVQAAALASGHLGIIVRRHAAGRATVALSGAVPYGMTEERDEWQSQAHAEVATCET